MTDRVDKQVLSRMVASAARCIQEQQALLSQLDCIAGDGDHGITMVRTLNHLQAVFQRDSGAGLKTYFCDAGWSVMGADGGSSSSLLGAFFLGIGEATPADVVSWNCREFAAALQAGLLAVEAQTKARVGDKTLIDALAPAVEACRTSAATDGSLSAAINAAAAAAKAGAVSTEALVARYGRARLLGERTRGHRDPGAVSIALIFEGFSQVANKMKGDIEHAGRG